MTNSRPRTKLSGVNRNRPCEVCGAVRRCSKGEDGSYQCLGRPDPAPSGFVLLHKGDEFFLYRRQDDPVLRERDEEYRRSRAGRSRSAGPAADADPWTLYAEGPPNGSHHHNDDRRSTDDTDVAALAIKCAANLTPERQAALADALGLPAWTLDTHEGIGYSPEGLHPGQGRKGPEWPCWTFPECDGAGRIIGVTARYPDGSKLALGKRGLTLLTDWRDRGGDLYAVEGFSCTAALSATGLAVVGRPSNMGGVDHLAALLADFPADRNIVFIGETDPKEDGSWPGQKGAVSGAEKLAAKLNRPVQWGLAPGGRKDSRDWVNAQALPPDCPDAWQEAGPRFVAALKRHTIKPEPKAGFVWEPIDSATFAAADYRPTWLIRRLLVKGQTAIAGGARKMLKTSLEIDMGVSLASGTPFLGEFAVDHPAKVAILSGESGPHTIQSTAGCVCRARGLHLGDLGGNLLWMFNLPQLARPDQLAQMQEGLKRDRVEVLIFDPLYLALLAGQGPGGADAANLFDMGPLLLGITRACLDVGTTPVLVHHAKKGTAASDKPLDLDDLSYSGVAEFARQWLLISRRKPYEPGTGQHKLLLSVGGSVGHGGLWAVDVDEGILREDFGGRTWDVTVTTATEARQDEQQTKKAAEQAKRLEKEREQEQALMTAVDRLTTRGETHGDDGRPAAGYTEATDMAGLRPNHRLAVVDRLVRAGLLRELTVKIATPKGGIKQGKGLRRVEDKAT